MTRTIRDLTLAFGVALLATPVLLAAQPGPGAREGRAGAITHLLNARRELDLTPRQLVQLDSLERIQYAERRQFNDRMRGARDSMMARARSGERAPAARDSLRAQARARMEAERPQLDQRRRRDSSLTAAAERILNDAQRQKMREMMAERRGYESGLREARSRRVGPSGAGSRERPQGGRPDGMRAPQRPDGMPAPQRPDGMRATQRPDGPGGPDGPVEAGPRRPPLDEPDRG